MGLFLLCGPNQPTPANRGHSGMRIAGLRYGKRRHPPSARAGAAEGDSRSDRQELPAGRRSRSCAAIAPRSKWCSRPAEAANGKHYCFQHGTRHSERGRDAFSKRSARRASCNTRSQEIESVTVPLRTKQPFREKARSQPVLPVLSGSQAPHSFSLQEACKVKSEVTSLHSCHLLTRSDSRILSNLAVWIGPCPSTCLRTRTSDANRLGPVIQGHVRSPAASL
jgi:hypothetical protein